MIKRNDGISKDDICQNQFTAYVVLAVKRKRQSYIKKKQREHEKETRTKKEAEQSEFRTAGYDMWSRMEPQNEKLISLFNCMGFPSTAESDARGSSIGGTDSALPPEPDEGVCGYS